MSEIRYPRSVALTVAKVTADSFFQTRDEVQVTDLRISFSIEKNLGANPNTATISVFNLAEDSRALFEGKPLQVRLEAGYDGDLATVFVGDLTFGQTVENGPDAETKLQLGDGHRAYNHARHSRSYPAGTTHLEMVQGLAKSMGVRVPKDAADAVELVRQVASGTSFSGPSRKGLTQVLRSRGMSWSIQDGNLQILTEDGLRPGEAFLLEEGSGLLGSPEFGPPQKKSGKRHLTVKHLLYPAIQPGHRIQVASLRVNGAFKVLKVSHTGDTAGPDWTTTIEGVPV